MQTSYIEDISRENTQLKEEHLQLVSEVNALKLQINEREITIQSHKAELVRCSEASSQLHATVSEYAETTDAHERNLMQTVRSIKKHMIVIHCIKLSLCSKESLNKLFLQR